MFPYSEANAALRVSNSALLKNQVQTAVNNSERAASTQALTPQPVRTVTNENGETITIQSQDIDACNAIYPNGAFDWVNPTMGTHRGGSAMCSALVELRAYQNSAGTSYNVLATGYVGAGDSVRCNIDDFSDLTLVGRDFTYPADSAPTVEEVAAVMAQENKSHAGLKILAAAVVGGIGGNILGRNDIGNDSLLGVGGDKLKTTAIGAAGGAALMTASTQVNDYKAGSIILSTGVNAAAGAVAGNLMASGDDVIKFGPCKIKDGEKGDLKDETCLYGSLDLKAAETKIYGETDNLFYDFKDKKTYKCEKEDSSNYKNCYTLNVNINSFVGADDNGIEVENNIELNEKWKKDNLQSKEITSYKIATNGSKTDKTINLEKDDGKGTIYKIASATQMGRRINAMIPVDKEYNQKLFGYKNWGDLKKELGKKELKIYNTRGELQSGAELDNFTPSWQSADDGDTIDFYNKARTKSTLIGTGGGAALGALSGAAGAESEIQQRWYTAVQEYEDSLGNIVCFTGDRYLAKYNDVIIIPEMKTEQ